MCLQIFSVSVLEFFGLVFCQQLAKDLEHFRYPAFLLTNFRILGVCHDCQVGFTALDGGICQNGQHILMLIAMKICKHI